MKYYKILKENFKGISYIFSLSNAHIKISADYVLIQENYHFESGEFIKCTIMDVTQEEIDNALNKNIIVEITAKEYNDFLKVVETSIKAEEERAEQIRQELEKEKEELEQGQGNFENGEVV